MFGIFLCEITDFLWFRNVILENCSAPTSSISFLSSAPHHSHHLLLIPLIHIRNPSQLQSHASLHHGQLSVSGCSYSFGLKRLYEFVLFVHHLLVHVNLNVFVSLQIYRLFDLLSFEFVIQFAIQLYLKRSHLYSLLVDQILFREHDFLLPLFEVFLPFGLLHFRHFLLDLCGFFEAFLFGKAVFHYD